MNDPIRIQSALAVALAAGLWTASAHAAEGQKPSPGPFSGLKLRLLDPGYVSGRISDFAVDPARPHRY
ncbi:MAG: hypothetical protein AAFV29_09275, partial [Myxococcota bacterium]